MANTSIYCKAASKARTFSELDIGALFYKSGDLSTPFRKNHHDIDPDLFNASVLGSGHSEDMNPEDQVVLIESATFEAER